jgi:hypothetical protein
MTREDADIRRTEQGNLIDAETLRGFARAALSVDAVQDRVNELLFEHVVGGRYHPSVVADSLRPIIHELLDTMTRTDWQIVADELIADARAVLRPPEEAPSGGPRCREV